jgi:CheY-like chemotaxis protein
MYPDLKIFPVAYAPISTGFDLYEGTRIRYGYFINSDGKSSHLCFLCGVKPASNYMLILIVDDDSEDCELFREAIAEIDSSIQCYAAQDGRDALHQMNHELVVLPDYIFLDINMPVMNGRECLIEIKKNTRLRQIPVIMYSTTSDTTEIKGFYELGAHDFLIKPANFKMLVEALGSIIVSSKSR